MQPSLLAFNFPHGTAIAAVQLSITQQLMIPQVTEDLMSYITNNYHDTTMILFLWINALSPIATYPNRQAYLGQLETWLTSCAVCLSTTIAAINAASTAAQALAVTPNYASISANPNVTLWGALAISN